MQLIDDRYELVEVVASGGMATVWRARDTRLNRYVAVKRPHPATPGDDSAQRIAREARAAASLSHPNLITVYDFGSDESGSYLVMELVEGSTLKELAGQIDAADVIEIGAQLADALAAIHAAGIVHRDVKPANVIMSERGPLLTDFGIAFDPEATAKITDPGTVVATPSYAAPEVLAGEEPTAASDVYSLAVTIDELVGKSGSKPGQDIDTPLGRAMSATPEDRPDAIALGEALRRGAPTLTGIASGESTLVLDAPPTGRDGDDEDSTRKRRPGWLWVAGLLVAAALALVVIGLALSDGDVPADAAPTPTEPTSLAADTTTTTQPTTTTTMPIEPTIAETRDELEAILLRPPRSELKRSDVEDTMKKVDEAIAAAEEGDLEKAQKKLAETAKRLEDKLEDEARDEAKLVLEQLASLLGVELDTEDDNDDD